MLELLIALLLVVTCALPLARMPLHSISAQYKSVYRIHMDRLADLAYKEILEKLYAHEIPWKDLSDSSKKVILNDVISAEIPGSGKQKFKRRATLSAVGKLGKNGDELRLVKIKIRLEPENKFHARSPIFTYQTIARRTPAPPPPPSEAPVNK